MQKSRYNIMSLTQVHFSHEVAYNAANHVSMIFHIRFHIEVTCSHLHIYYFLLLLFTDAGRNSAASE